MSKTYTALYLVDSYIREFSTTVTNVDKDAGFVELETTAFYPSGGGQPSDTGTVSIDDTVFSVVNVEETSNKICHFLESSVTDIVPGMEVKGVLDWERRYRHMRMHTASHVLSAVFLDKFEAKITGNQIGQEKTRFDFSLENFDRDKIQDCIDAANRLINQNSDVKTYFLKRDEALKIPNIIKLAGTLPPNLDTLRVVEIQDVDIQADGGTHVKNTKEIGEIKLVKMENKGKSNRRVYFALIP